MAICSRGSSTGGTRACVIIRRSILEFRGRSRLPTSGAATPESLGESLGAGVLERSKSGRGPVKTALEEALTLKKRKSIVPSNVQSQEIPPPDVSQQEPPQQEDPTVPDQRTEQIYELGPFQLDLLRGLLVGPDGELHLRPQAYRLLALLVEQAPRILPRDEILDAVWGVEHISPSSLKQTVSEVRRTLGDDPAEPIYIETVPRRGYRFIGEVRAHHPRPETPLFAETDTAEPPQASGHPPRTGESETGRRWMIASLCVLGLSIVGILGLYLFLGPTANPSSGPSIRPSLAILGFRGISEHQAPWVATALTELTSVEILTRQALRVVPAESVFRLRARQDIPSVDQLAPDTLNRLGDHLGADWVASGSYWIHDQGALRIHLVVQETSSGATVAVLRKEGRLDALDRAVLSLTDDMLARLGVQGADTPSSSAARSALPHHPESLSLYTRGLDKLRGHELSEAIELLRKAAEREPESALIFAALADAWDRMGNAARAREAASRAGILAAGLPRTLELTVEGRSRVIRKEWSEAAEIYGALWRFAPDDLEIGLELTRCLRNLGETAKVEQILADLRSLPLAIGSDPRITLLESNLSSDRGNFPKALEAAEQALREARDADRPLLVAAAREHQAWALFRLGRAEETLEAYGDAEQTYRRSGDELAAAVAEAGKASVLIRLGRLEQAEEILLGALDIFRRLEAKRLMGRVLNNLAAVASKRGNTTDAESYLRRSLDLKRDIEDRSGLAMALTNLADLEIYAQRPSHAYALLNEAVELNKTLGDRHREGLALLKLSKAHRLGADLESAHEAALKAAQLFRHAGDPTWTAQAQNELARVARDTGEWDRASEHCRRALEGFQAVSDARGAMQSKILAAEIALRRGRIEEAESDLDRLDREWTETPNQDPNLRSMIEELRAELRRIKTRDAS